MRSFFSFLLLVIVLAPACKKDKKQPEPTPTISVLDSRFTVTGTMKDFSNATYAGNYPHEITLVKDNSTQGTIVPKALGIPGHMILIGGSQSYYSQFAIKITIDASTNKITSITNSYGQPSANGRSATLDPSGINAWNPTTKELKIKYWMDEPAVTTPHRSSFDETWSYLGPK